jgi:hypothetical protein
MIMTSLTILFATDVGQPERVRSSGERVRHIYCVPFVNRHSCRASASLRQDWRDTRDKSVGDGLLKYEQGKEVFAITLGDNSMHSIVFRSQNLMRL